MLKSFDCTILRQNQLKTNRSGQKRFCLPLEKRTLSRHYAQIVYRWHQGMAGSAQIDTAVLANCAPDAT